MTDKKDTPQLFIVDDKQQTQEVLNHVESKIKSGEVSETFLDVMMRAEAKLESLRVTQEAYKESIIQLVHLARGDSGGSFVVAQVILNLNFNSSFHTDLTDLCRLDPFYLDYCLTAIRGRIFYGYPADIIENGHWIFRNLAEEWTEFNTKNRYLDH